MLQSYEDQCWFPGLLLSLPHVESQDVPDEGALMRAQQVLAWLQVVIWVQAPGCFWCYIFLLQKKKKKEQCQPSRKSAWWKSKFSKVWQRNCSSENAKLNQQLFLSKEHDSETFYRVRQYGRWVICFKGYCCMMPNRGRDWKFLWH